MKGNLFPSSFTITFCIMFQNFWTFFLFCFFKCPGILEQNCISHFYPEFVLQRKEAIFSHVGSSGDSVINTILALARYFIYKQKFTSKELDEIKFLNYMRDHLEIIYQTKVNKNHERKFLE